MGKYIFDAPAHHTLDLTGHGIKDLIHGGEEFVADLEERVEAQLKGAGVRSLDSSVSESKPTETVVVASNPVVPDSNQTSSAPGKPEGGAVKP